MKTSKKQIKFTLVWVVALVIVAAVGFTGWFAYHSSQAANATLQSANKVSSDIPKLPQIKTFADCQKSPGSKTITTYPEQCIATGGKMFTDDQKTLTIKEWNVKFTYVSTDTLSYKIGDPDNTATIVSQGLSKQYGCTTFGAGIINREAGSARDGMMNVDETVAQSYAKDPSSFTKVGDYYYRFFHDQAACQQGKVAASLPDAENKANDFTKTLVPKLVSAN